MANVTITLRVGGQPPFMLCGNTLTPRYTRKNIAAMLKAQFEPHGLRVKREKR